MTTNLAASRSLRRLGMACACSVVALSTGAAGAWPTLRPAETPDPLVLTQAQATQDSEMKAFEELNEALEAARRKLDQLTGAAEFTAHATDLRRQLEAAEGDNQDLRDQLERLAKAQDAAARQLTEMAAQIGERDRQLEEVSQRTKSAAAAAERSRAEAARLRKQLGTAEEKLGGAEQARAAAEGKLADMQAVVESALSEAAAMGRKFAELEKTGAEAQAALARLEEERDEARRQLVSEREARTRLEREIAQARDALDERTLERAALEKQVAALRGAANEARDAARQNLQAVEEKIRLLNQALAEIRPDQSEQQTPAAGADGPGRDSLGAPRYPIPGPSSEASDLAPVRAANAAEREDFDNLNASTDTAEPAGPITLAEATSRLPMEKRVQAESLLADLKADRGPEGVVMRVPGEELFAVDSDVIEATAHDTLAKVAELISMFEDREIRIVGHTDAMGDADYNQTLSERRAGLVKEFFVQNYDLPDARLKVIGAGERQPIATNTTRSGRRANRRIEVVIED